MKNKIAIVIVIYNISNLISMQIDLIKRFCKDNSFDIIIIDNSSDTKISNELRVITNNKNCNYIKRGSYQGEDFSQSHAAACNFAYEKVQNYEYMFFLDHDNFPITNFSIENILNDKIIGGLGQIRKTKTYFWPGCVMLNNYKIDHSLIDFSINSSFGLDTGGMLYRIIEAYGQNNCVFFDEYYEDNISENGINYGNYSLINKMSLSFMHFRNASNWNYIINNKERINSLINILNNKTKEMI
jgi:glycosyltransferase involved in cell wall biosynthesis